MEPIVLVCDHCGTRTITKDGREFCPKENCFTNTVTFEKWNRAIIRNDGQKREEN